MDVRLDSISMDELAPDAEEIFPWVPTLESFPLALKAHEPASPGLVAIIAPSNSPLTDEFERLAIDRGIEHLLLRCSVPDESVVMRLNQSSRRPSTIIYAAAFEESVEWNVAKGGAVKTVLSRVFSSLHLCLNVLMTVPVHERPNIVTVTRAERPVQVCIPAIAQSLALERRSVAVTPVVIHDGADISACVVHVLDLCGRSSANRCNSVVHLTSDGPARRALCALVPEPARSLPPVIVPDSQCGVVVVSGGGRGILVPMLCHLAKQMPLHLIVTGRTPEEAAEFDAEDLEDGQALMRKLMETEPMSTPSSIRDRIERARKCTELQSGLQQLRSVAESVRYHEFDVSDSEKFEALLDTTFAHFGRVDGVVHGAGVVCNKSFDDHSLDDFNRVIMAKIAPMSASCRWLARGNNLGFFVGISSTAAYFGNVRQTSYAGANAMVEALVENVLRRLHPDVTSAWVGYSGWERGMVTPALRRIMATLDMSVIPDALGAPTLAETIASAKTVPGRLYFPADGPFVDPIEYDDHSRCLVEVLSAVDGVARVCELTQQKGALIECRCGTAFKRISDHKFHNKIIVIPASYLQSLAVSLAQAWSGDESYSRVLSLIAKDILCVTGPDTPFFVRVQPRSDESLEFIFESEGVVRSEIVVGRSQSDDRVAITPGVELAVTRGSWPDNHRLYGPTAIDLGAAFRMVEEVEEWSADGIRARVMLCQDRSPVESIAEAVAQVSSVYCLFNFDSTCIPYKIEDFDFAELPRPGTSVRVELRRNLQSLAGNLVSVTARITDDDDVLVAFGGPFVSFSFCFAVPLQVGDHCVVSVTPTRLADMAKLLGGQGVDWRNACYTPNEIERWEITKSAGGGKNGALIFAVKSVLQRWAAFNGVELHPTDVEPELIRDGIFRASLESSSGHRRSVLVAAAACDGVAVAGPTARVLRVLDEGVPLGDSIGLGLSVVSDSFALLPGENSLDYSSLTACLVVHGLVWTQAASRACIAAAARLQGAEAGDFRIANLDPATLQFVCASRSHRVRGDIESCEEDALRAVVAMAQSIEELE